MHNKANSYLGGASTTGLDNIIVSGECPHNDDDPIPWDDQWFILFSLWNSSLNEKGEYALFIFSKNPSTHEYDTEITTIYTIGSCSTIQKGIYIAGKASTGHAKAIINIEDYQHACSYIAQHPELSSLPTVSLGLEKDTFSYYPTGIKDGQNSLRLLCTMRQQLSLSDLIANIDAHTNNHMITQEFRQRIWENSAKWWAKENAEAIVQYDLLVVLRSRYHSSHTIESEPRTASGRADIKCVPKDGQSEKHGILELKVLRTFGSTGRTYRQTEWDDALRKGAGQAYSYAQDNNASIKILCIFDMRKDHDFLCIRNGERECTRLGVTFKHYNIPNSSQQIRDERASMTQKK